MSRRTWRRLHTVLALALCVGEGCAGGELPQSVRAPAEHSRALALSVGEACAGCKSLHCAGAPAQYIRGGCSASAQSVVLTRRHHVRSWLSLRGGAIIGPLRVGPFSLVLDPTACVYMNAVAGIMYSMSLIGLDPNLPDPTLRYWQQPQTPATRAILQFFALALMWINWFILYAMWYLKAPATGLLRFQSFGWASILGLIGYQTSHFGFRAQQDTLGIQITLLVVSAYLGFAP